MSVGVGGIMISSEDVELLVHYVIDHAGDHEEDCPCDDTCTCKYKPRNDAVNRLCHQLVELTGAEIRYA